MNENFLTSFVIADTIAAPNVKDPEARRRIATLSAILSPLIGPIVAMQLSGLERQAEARRAAAAGGGSKNEGPPAAGGDPGSPPASGTGTPPPPVPETTNQAVERLANSADSIVAVIQKGGERLLGELEKIADGLERSGKTLWGTATADAPLAAEAAPPKKAK